MMADAALPHRGRRDHLVRHRLRPRLHLPARRGRARLPPAAARGRGGLRRGLPRQEHPRHAAFDLDITVHAGAGAYICGEETALLDSLEGRRGQPRLKPPFPGRRRPLRPARRSVNNVESIASVPRDHRSRAPTGSPAWAPRSPPGFGIFSLSGHVKQPRPVRGAARHHAARAARHGRRHARPRQGAEVLDPRRLARRRCSPTQHLDVPLDFESVGRGGLDARHPRAADLRRDRLRRARRRPLDRVLQARVLRQVHPVPRGHLVAQADPRPARARPGQRGRPRQAARHLRQHPRPQRSAPWATARPARSPAAIQYFRDEYVAHLTHGGCPFDPKASTLFAKDDKDSGARMTDHARPTTTARRRAAPAADLVTLTIDGSRCRSPKGTLVIRAAEEVGIQIPRFCDHPLLDPVGACRQCLVEVDPGRPGPTAPGRAAQMQGPDARSRRPRAR